MNYIGFPGLHLEFNINPVAFSLLGKNIYWYGIIITSGFLLCLWLASRDDNLHNIKYDDVIDFIILCVPISIIGARIYYVIGRYDYYIDNPSEIIKIWNGGIAIFGAIIFAILTGYIYCKYKKISLLSLMDYCVPYLALGQSIGRWGNFVNAEAYGYVTNLPWRMRIFDKGLLKFIEVHPTFLYESILDLIIFIILFNMRKKTKSSGQLSYIYMLLYGTGRFFIEGLRTDSLMMGPFRISQIISLCIVIFSLLMMYINSFKNRPTKTYNSIIK